MRRLRMRGPRSRGQALVEFSLSAMLILTLLAATVDLGFVFFSLQAMRAAAQEGAVYGSNPVRIDGSGSSFRVDLNYNEIRDRVRMSSGGRAGVVNLLDLNSNGTDDAAENAAMIDPRALDSYIFVENLKDVNNNGDPRDDGGVECITNQARVDMRNGADGCFIRVTVRYRYNMFFPIIPEFGRQITLRSSVIMPVSSSFVG